MTRDELTAEVSRLRAGIRAHRDASGHALCWHHPQLWGLLPEPMPEDIKVPAWPQFLRGCIRYREPLDHELPKAPRTNGEFSSNEPIRNLKPDQADIDGHERPAVVRIWRGRTKRERADEYESYNYEAGVKPLIEKALGLQAFREDRTSETEFLTISYWKSVEAMSHFTGGDPLRIHHLDRDPEYLIELPTAVQILQIRASHGNIGSE
jgi:hypothetical protein